LIEKNQLLAIANNQQNIKSSREIELEALLSEKDQLLALKGKEEMIKENIALSSRLTDLESLMSKKNRLIALKTSGVCKAC